jgi:hypothetical protein
LRKWIDSDRAGLRTRTRLTESVRDWQNSGREPTYLYSGARLAVAEEWAASHPGELNIDEAEFLRCSREAQKQRAELSEQRWKDQMEAAEKLWQAARRQRRRAIAAAGATVAAVILLVMSVVLWRAAQEQARIANVRRLAAQSSALLAKYPQRSLLLAVEAVRAGKSIQTSTKASL